MHAQYSHVSCAPYTISIMFQLNLKFTSLTEPASLHPLGLYIFRSIVTPASIKVFLNH